MHELDRLYLILVLLASAVITVSVLRQFRVSPILGYLIAGAAIGPGGLAIVQDIEGTRAIAEFGVVFLLFIIGLELSWERLRDMRLKTFIIGILQVVVTTTVLTTGLCFAGFTMQSAIIIGGGLALSSTALVLQLVAESNLKSTQLGRLTLAVLLVQDLAVVPLIVLIPALNQPSSSLGMEIALVAGKVVCVLLAILIIGRVVLRKLYRIIASLQNPEIFTALSLLVVLGTGWLTAQAGLSLALGAFIAGLLLAETEYRHQVEADVLPYKGIFLGLFFMSVGMSFDIHAVLLRLPYLLNLAFGLIAAKALLIFFVCQLMGVSKPASLQAGLLLSQGGEFAFILFGLAAEHHLLSTESVQILIIVVTMTMALTPFSAALASWAVRKSEHRRRRRVEDFEQEITDVSDHIIILGFGRVGQMIAKLLSAENIHYIALDTQSATSSKARKIGLPVYYGDGARREVLQSLGVDRARAAIITINEPVAAERMVRALRSVSPTLPIIARARDQVRVEHLEAAGANVAVSEMFEASLQLGGALLRSIGVTEHEVSRIIDVFRNHDHVASRGSAESQLPAK